MIVAYALVFAHKESRPEWHQYTSEGSRQIFDTFADVISHEKTLVRASSGIVRGVLALNLITGEYNVTPI